MTVLASKRSESKLEVIERANKIKSMLVKLMQRDLGIKDHNKVIRKVYKICAKSSEDIFAHAYLISQHKERINRFSSEICDDLRAANTIYPTSMEEYNQRREYQNKAIVSCELIIGEFQQIIEVFDVDINVYKIYIEALYDEIKLIKKWRQSDNKLKKFIIG